jgi:hypothetical protein
VQFIAQKKEQTLYPGGIGLTIDQYASYRAQLKAGEILIQRNGEIGAIKSSECNPKTDAKL